MLSHIPPHPHPCPHFSFHFRPEACWDFSDVEKGHTLIAALQSSLGGGGARGWGAEGRTSRLCVSPTPRALCCAPTLTGTGKEGIEIFKDQVDPRGPLAGRILSCCGCNSPWAAGTLPTLDKKPPAGASTPPPWSSFLDHESALYSTACSL